jgi:MFS family permease
MTFEDLAPVWHSPRNVPDFAELERYKQSIASHLSKEYRQFVTHVGMAAALTIFLAGGFVQYLRGGGAFDWAHEWASIVFLLLPIAVATIFLRGFIQHRRRHGRYDVSIVEGLRAMIDENRLARLRLRVSMIALTLAMVGLPLVTYQLQLVGKQRPHEAESMLAVFGFAYVIAMGWQVWKYRRRLMPERTRLEELLRSYGASSV